MRDDFSGRDAQHRGEADAPVTAVRSRQRYAGLAGPGGSMKMYRSRTASHTWIFRLQAKYLLILAAASYFALGTVLPYALRDH